MNLSAIIFKVIFNSIKLIGKALMPYLKFFIFTIINIKKLFCFLLIYLLIEITVILIKKYKQSIQSNNKDIQSVLVKTNTNNSNECSECGKKINYKTKVCPYCGNQLKKTNLALIFTGISLLINPIGIFSIISIIFGIIQLADPNNNTEKGWTIISIIVSILITLLWIFILRNK